MFLFCLKQKQIKYAIMFSWLMRRKKYKKKSFKEKEYEYKKFENITNNQMSEVQKKKKNPIVIRTDFGKTVTFVLVIIIYLKYL